MSNEYRPLDHAMEILRSCVTPYTGEQAQKVAKALGALRGEVESRRRDCECYANHLAKNRDTITALRDRVAELEAAVALMRRHDDRLTRLREWIPDASCPNECGDGWVVDADDLTAKIDELLAEHGKEV